MERPLPCDLGPSFRWAEQPEWREEASSGESQPLRTVTVSRWPNPGSLPFLAATSSFTGRSRYYVGDPRSPTLPASTALAGPCETRGRFERCLMQLRAIAAERTCVRRCLPNCRDMRHPKAIFSLSTMPSSTLTIFIASYDPLRREYTGGRLGGGIPPEALVSLTASSH